MEKNMKIEKKTKEKPLEKIIEIIKSEWNKIELYQITQMQEAYLVSTQLLTKELYRFEKGKKFPEHSHSIPQLLLVKQGELTHYTKGKVYTQYPYEILIVPANLTHSAEIGKLEDLILYVFHKRSLYSKILSYTSFTKDLYNTDYKPQCSRIQIIERN